MINKAIYQYLNKILGEPLNAIGRASNMLWLGIGQDIEVKDINGKSVIKSTIALHVQSTWRIVNKEKGEIIVASSDFYSPKSTSDECEDFKWEIQGNNLFDEKSKKWLERVKPVYIEKYKLNGWGDLLLILSNQERIEIYVDSSDDTESWRLFKCNGKDKHLVVSGLGISFE